MRIQHVNRGEQLHARPVPTPGTPGISGAANSPAGRVPTRETPTIMGIAPVPATKKVLEKTGLSLTDFDVVEINEAFAAQVLACDRELKFDHEKLNVNGGAIAIGHPIGMSGARIILAAAYEMRDKGYSLGLATLCVSGGQGMSVVLERS